MSHLPSRAMPHARSAVADGELKPSRGWGRLWLIGGLVAASTFAALGALRAAA